MTLSMFIIKAVNITGLVFPELLMMDVRVMLSEKIKINPPTIRMYSSAIGIKSLGTLINVNSGLENNRMNELMMSEKTKLPNRDVDAMTLS